MIGGTLDEQRQVATRRAMKNPAKSKQRVVHKKVYVSCDGIMYCASQREMCLSDPTRNRLIWRQMRLSCVY